MKVTDPREGGCPINNCLIEMSRKNLVKTWEVLPPITLVTGKFSLNVNNKAIPDDRVARFIGASWIFFRAAWSNWPFTVTITTLETWVRAPTSLFWHTDPTLYRPCKGHTLWCAIGVGTSREPKLVVNLVALQKEGDVLICLWIPCN